jgi:hypothetical protein
MFKLRTAEIQSDKVNNVPKVSITNTNGFDGCGRDSENFGQSGSFPPSPVLYSLVSCSESTHSLLVSHS